MHFVWWFYISHNILFPSCSHDFFQHPYVFLLKSTCSRFDVPIFSSMKIKICGCFPIKYLHFQIIVPYSWRYLSMENPLCFSVFLLKSLCFPVKITIFSRICHKFLFSWKIFFLSGKSIRFPHQFLPWRVPCQTAPRLGLRDTSSNGTGLALPGRGGGWGVDGWTGDSLPKCSEIEKSANFWRDFPPEMATS